MDHGGNVGTGTTGAGYQPQTTGQKIAAAIPGTGELH